MRTRPAVRVAGLSPRRRVLLVAVALVVIALGAFGGIQLARSGSGSADPSASCPSHVLPTDPLVVGIVLRDLGQTAPAAPGPAQCHSLQPWATANDL